MNFGEKVKQLRAERNLTQPQLAQAIGIEQSYLSKLENDKSVPSAEIFQSILRAFSLDVATFLEGVDDKIVHRDLRQVPEVANHLNGQVHRKIHSIRTWLFASGIACALGLSLAAAGYWGWLLPNRQYNYISDGVVLPGEPTNIFDIHTGLLHAKLVAKLISEEDYLKQAEEFGRRLDSQPLLLDDYRGEAFVESVKGGQRLYKLPNGGQRWNMRGANRWLQFVGALLTFGGLLGFIIEARLRSVRVT